MKNKFKLLGLLQIAIIIFVVTTCDIDEEDDPVYGWYGSGSATNYTISTVAQLKGLADIVRGTWVEDIFLKNDFSGKTITLTADINVVDQGWKSIGHSYLPLYPFNGTFDGNNKTISGVTILFLDQGFFGLIGEYGIVKNLIFTNFTLDGTDGTGGLARTSDGIIQNVSITGNLNGSSLGGIVCFNRGTVQDCNFSGIITGWGVTGGIASSNSGMIRNCNTSGEFIDSGMLAKGSIVGSNYGTVQNCFSTASGVDDIVGYNDGTIIP